MKITRLHVTNFLTLGNACVNLADRGLNVIQGVNDADTSATSNGAGKSSIVDALCWCLYGVTARGVKGDAVVNRTAKKGTEVRVHIEYGEQEFVVARFRKHAEHKNTLYIGVRPKGDPGRELDDLSKGTDAETQKEVERLLGCSLDVFIAAVYAGQEMMPDLPRMTDRDLKRLIEEAAGLQRIEAAYGEARQRRLALNAKADALSSSESILRTRMARDEGALILRENDSRGWVLERDERIARADAVVKAATAELMSAALAAKEAKPASEAAQQRLNEFEGHLARHSELSRLAQVASNDSARAAAAVGRAVLMEARQTVATIESQIANADVEMAKPCPECGKPHTEDEKAEYIAHRTKRLVDAKANLKLVEERVRAEIARVTELKQAADEAAARVPDVSAIRAESATHLETIADFKRKLDLANVKKSELAAAKMALEARIAEVNPYEKVVEQLRGQLMADADALAKLTVEGEQLRAKIAVADAVVKVFGPAGVRAHILDTVTPFLNARTADYLSALSDGAITAIWSTLSKSASGELKEKFAIEVTSSTGGDSFAALSGGEKRKVRLATALALQDLVASRATRPIDLWIGDEVDDALDPAGLERLMTIMERKARERGTVLIISHNELADWCDAVTTVRKKDGFSVVEGSLCA